VLSLSARGDFHFNIETKLSASAPDLAPPPDEFARLVLDVVRRHKLESRVIVQSFDFRTLHALGRMAPEIRLCALVSEAGADYVAAARDAGAIIIAPEHRSVTAEKVAAAHEAGLDVVPWTANEPADWDRLIKAGVDGIITDDPAALVEHLKGLGLR
jgi:glycerophosphoryl diester phosphodiesterase